MWKHRIAALTLVLLLVIMAAVPAAAYEKRGTVTVILTDGGDPVSRIPLEIFRVADADGKLLPDFEDCGVISPESAEDALQLTEYAEVNRLEAYDSGKTDREGKLVFAGLPEGLYLICQNQSTPEHSPISPFFAPIPLEGDQYVYTAKPKMDHDTSPERGDLEVEKVWIGENDHPDRITVELWYGDTLYDTVTLSDRNDWYHVWEDLPESNKWEIREAEVEGYTTVIIQNKYGFIIENTEEGYEPEPDPGTNPETDPDGGKDPDPDGGKDPDPDDGKDPDPDGGKDPDPDDGKDPDPDGGKDPDPDGGKDPDPDGGKDPDPDGGKDPDPDEGDTLIKTGQLKWPIPVLALAGVFLFALGWSMTFLRARRK